MPASVFGAGNVLCRVEYCETSPFRRLAATGMPLQPCWLRRCGFSTLMTRAPWSAINCVAAGPGRNSDRSNGEPFEFGAGGLFSRSPSSLSREILSPESQQVARFRVVLADFRTGPIGASGVSESLGIIGTFSGSPSISTVSNCRARCSADQYHVFDTINRPTGTLAASSLLIISADVCSLHHLAKASSIFCS